MSVPSCLPPFDSLAARIGMFELSNILTHAKWLEFFIRLIPTEKLRTELYLLHFVLKGRVYLGDTWQIVAGQRDFMEEKRDRCQLEVSLCSQAIDHVEQRWTIPTSRRIMEPTTAYSVATRNKCESWLRRQKNDPIPPKEIASIESASPLLGSSSAVGQFSLLHLEKRTLVTVNSDDPSFSLQSTWVTICLQEAFQEARKVELSTQARLMSMYLDVEGYHTHHRNAHSELIFLRAKMRRAQAEAAVYTLALENSPASTYSDSDSDSSPRPVLPQHPPEEVHRYMECMDVESINSRTDSDSDACPHFGHGVIRAYIHSSKYESSEGIGIPLSQGATLRWLSGTHIFISCYKQLKLRLRFASQEYHQHDAVKTGDRTQQHSMTYCATEVTNQIFCQAIVVYASSVSM
ncbi:hypothetical protein DEU56DRAFT_758036 [Suillus clintonianus]|uniref:uncharacterized protein n=1 Tax=Suillus clintonianus TaxID=1904413 RepID=UPI001B86407D|nr:uncharacterized protein DEU56DRAFT_758036 [Suillus clintonianus]KAG2129751.1 hypothetical protein DEU56DRAFT_758036 [Suillus clintonianus]